MNFKFFSKNGQILPTEQALIPIENIAYSYGFGVYESIKVRNGIVYFVDRHIERLKKSAEIIGLTHPFTKTQITMYIKEVIEKNNSNSSNIKILLIGANKKENAMLFIIPLAPLYPDSKLYKQGAKTITQYYERIFPNAKTLNMLGSYLAYKKAAEQNCYDALLRDQNRNVLEGTRTNFFTIKNKTLFTPPTEKILKGVTRDTVFYVAKKNGFVIEEVDIPVTALESYDGCFLTSTSSKIIPIRQIDNIVLRPIPETVKQLIKVYDIFLDGCKGVFSPE